MRKRAPGAGRQDAMAGISPAGELIDDAVCELVGIGPERAGEYALALAADGLELPEGWSASDPYRGLVGWDVILVAPRSLSILRGDLVDSYFSRREYRLSVEGADPEAVECDPDLEQTYSRQEQLAQAHVRAAEQAAGELTRLLDAGAPRVLDHPLDSEGHLLQHTHLVLGARLQRLPAGPGAGAGGGAVGDRRLLPAPARAGGRVVWPVPVGSAGPGRAGGAGGVARGAGGRLCGAVSAAAAGGGV
jgi:hypothetical protein